MNMKFSAILILLNRPRPRVRNGSFQDSLSQKNGVSVTLPDISITKLSYNKAIIRSRSRKQEQEDLTASVSSCLLLLSAPAPG